MKHLLLLLLVSISFADWVFPLSEPLYIGKQIVCTDWYSNYRTVHGRKYKYQAVNYPCRYGALILSPCSGVITHTEIDGYEGAIITIRDDKTGNDITICHLSKFLVLDDSRVSAGQPIALAGKSGRTTGCHVRIRIDKNGERQFVAASSWGMKYEDFYYSPDKINDKKMEEYK